MADRTIEIEGLGKLTRDDRFDSVLRSEPIEIPVLLGARLPVQTEGFADDPNPDEFREAIANFLACDESVLKAASAYVFDYYRDIAAECGDEPDFVEIAASGDVWDHVQFAGEPCVARRAYGDKAVYVSVECNCDWEPEHGLQIVFRQGKAVNKVGPFNGHLSNADAYDDKALEDTVYCSLS